MNNVEIWKPVNNYETLYLVSNLGRIKSRDNYVFNGKGYYLKKGRILKQSFTTTGYKKVELIKNKIKKSKRIHRLVAEDFLQSVEGKNIVNHKNGNKLDNSCDNLEWCTHQENVQHAVKIGIKRKVYISKSILIALHYKQKNSAVKIANFLNTTPTIIRNRMKEYGLKILKFKKYEIDRKNILEISNMKTQKNIAKEYGCDPSLISKIIKEERGKIWQI